MPRNRKDIRPLIRRLLEGRGAVTSTEVAKAAGLSRPSAVARLDEMVRAGELVREGLARATRYVLASGKAPIYRHRFSTHALSEDQVLKEMEAQLPALRKLPTALSDAFAYALTEMVNNVIDHSGSARYEVALWLDGKGLNFEVEDSGVGAFERFRRALKLPDHLTALQEISKGKSTSAQSRHSGEGIFFTSKVASWFELEANALRWVVDNRRHDTAIAPGRPGSGTRVRVELDAAHVRPIAEVFAEYSHDSEFDVTRAHVKLFEYGERFVSRSEAKRLAAGLEKFRGVILDFAGVRMVGQGFADELFRVWGAAHPNIVLKPVNMNAAVALMVQRALPRT